MRLHLPKALLAALLAACLSWPAGASTLTSETTTIGGVKYSGYVIEYEGRGNQEFHKGTFATPTVATDTGKTLAITNASGGTNTQFVTCNSEGVAMDTKQDLWKLFCSESNLTHGHTLKLNTTESTDGLTLTCTFKPITIGGLISMGSASSYTLASSGDRKIELSSNSRVNMAIGVNTTLKANGEAIEVKTGGSWVISEGKSLTLSSTSTNGVTIASEQTVNVTASGDGTENAFLNITGAINNSGKLSIGENVSMTLSGNYSGTTITNAGTINLSGNLTIAVDRLTGTKIKSGDTSVSGLLTVGGTFTLSDGNGTVNQTGTLAYTFQGMQLAVNLQDGNKQGEITDMTYYLVANNDTKSYSDVSQTMGDTTDLINVLGTLSGISNTTLSADHRIYGNGRIQVDSGNTISYSTLANQASNFNGTLVLSGSTFDLDSNNATFSNSISVADNSSLILSENMTLGGAITATSGKKLSVSLAEGVDSGTLTLNGASGKLSGATLEVNKGVNVSVSNGGNAAACVRGNVVVAAGGTLTLTAGDALGYNGSQTSSITLAGSAADGYATLDLGTTGQTMQTALNLNGYAKITGTGDGSFNSWSNVASTNTDTFSKITVNGNYNEITCKVLVRQGLEVSVSENSSLEIGGAVEPKTGSQSGQSNAGFKKTGAGLLTITGDTSMDKQLQVQGGTMAVAGTTNSLNVDVKVSDGATLTLAGTTSLNGTLSSVAAGDDASAASTALIAITGGKTTISGGGDGNGNYVGTIRVDQGAELSITSGHSNVLTDTKGKVVVNGTLSIGDKTGVNTAESFYNVSGTGLITSAQSYTETTVDDTTTTTGRLVTINLSSTDAFSGSVTATAGQVKLSGGRAENTLNTITANGGNVVIDSNMSAKTISTSGTSAVSVTSTATLLHDHMTYSGSTISGSNFSMLIGGTVSGGTVTQTGQEDAGYKELNAKLDGVHFVSNEGTEAHLNNSANSLTALTVNGTVKLTAKAAVTGSTNVGTNGKLYVASEESSLGAVSGAGTVSSSVNQSVKLSTNTDKAFSGTLEATNGQLTVTGMDLASEVAHEMAGLKANGGNINLLKSSSVELKELVIGANNTVGVYKGDSAPDTATTANEGTLTVTNLTANSGSILNANLEIGGGTLTLNDSLTMGSTLRLNSGITLGGTAWNGWTDKTQALTLFTSVDSLYIGTTEAEVNKEYDASTVFTNGTGYSLKMTTGDAGSYNVLLVQSSPEPTTATLSLLALMALAARRRRKA